MQCSSHLICAATGPALPNSARERARQLKCCHPPFILVHSWPPICSDCGLVIYESLCTWRLRGISQGGADFTHGSRPALPAAALCTGKKGWPTADCANLENAAFPACMRDQFRGA
jgi:hypothetical protein